MKNGRNTAGQFSSSNSGRPRGSRNKAKLAIESLLQGQAEALTQTTIKKHWKAIALPYGFVWIVLLRHPRMP
jgi:hypothetical protein